MTLKLLSIMIVSLFLTSCTYRGSLDAFEDLYTDVQIIKPNAKNYQSSENTSTTPIIKESTPPATLQTEKQSVHIKETGRILSTIYDENVKLYIYNFISEASQEQLVFYYDKKLKFTSSSLINVNILDNYLISATEHKNKVSKKLINKKKYIKHMKRNRNIREAIEEKINTF